jgi:hypothetical protein
MFKKTLLVGAVALAVAGAASADGFYVGAGIGGIGLHQATSITFVNDYGDTDHLSNDGGTLGVTGGLLAGYNFNFANQMNLGIEGFANMTSAKQNSELVSTSGNDVATVSTVLKEKYNYGVRLVPGYQVTPDSDMHVLVGYVRGHFTANSENTNANGFQLGLGSTTSVTKEFSLRGDIIYSGYKSKSASVSEPDGNAYSLSTKNNTLEGVVSGEYKFG